MARDAANGALKKPDGTLAVSGATTPEMALKPLGPPGVGTAN